MVECGREDDQEEANSKNLEDISEVVLEQMECLLYEQKRER